MNRPSAGGALEHRNTYLCMHSIEFEHVSTYDYHSQWMACLARQLLQALGG